MIAIVTTATARGVKRRTFTNFSIIFVVLFFAKIITKIRAHSGRVPGIMLITSFAWRAKPFVFVVPAPCAICVVATPLFVRIKGVCATPAFRFYLL
jgi:hypothetical protein